MDNFIDLCTKRQSCRDFSDKVTEHEKLLKCVEAARLAPSACNSQPWKFIVVENQELVPKIAKCTQELGINSYVDGAKAFFIVLEDHAVLMPKIRGFLDSQYFAKGDLGAAAVTLCYQAQEQGLGTCILGIYNREKLCELLDLPLSTTRFFCVIAVGYPNNDRTLPKTRKSVEQIATFVR